MSKYEALGLAVDDYGQVYSLEVEAFIEDYALAQREQLYEEISGVEQRLHSDELDDQQRRNEILHYNYTSEQIRKLTDFAIHHGLIDKNIE